MLADEPTVPVVGLSPVADAFTVKLLAEVAVFKDASVTTTLRAPFGTAGIVNVTVEVPSAAVVPPPVMVAVVPPTFTVSAELAAKPCAVMLADEPTVPLVGFSPVADGVIVKVAVAEFDEPSVTFTV